MVKNSKNAISPVIATALLLVVAVVAVVAFQAWFTSYQSGSFANVEQQSEITLNIERLEFVSGGNATVYIRNSANSESTISELRILSGGTQHCINDSGITIAAASTDSETIGCDTPIVQNLVYEVVMVTASGVLSQTLTAR